MHGTMHGIRMIITFIMKTIWMINHRLVKHSETTIIMNIIGPVDYSKPIS